MKKVQHAIFCIDFDGTCVTHEFPKVGKDLPGAVDTLRKIVAHGGKLILWTMRSNNDVPPVSDDLDIHCEIGNYLDDAIKWFSERKIPLFGIQRNPEQDTWTSSPKAYAHIYIDDAALGCPMTYDTGFSERPFVNWDKIDNMLFNTHEEKIKAVIVSNA